MSGLFLIIFAVLAVAFLIISFIDDYNDDAWHLASIVFFVLVFIFLAAIPISKIDSKTNAEYVKVLQETIDANRIDQKEMDVMERMAIIGEINECNMKITTWKVKGKHWYNNKWYYHPDVQKAEYVK
jgi:uncharacterized membrane protein YbhN (UPF0104 family)